MSKKYVYLFSEGDAKMRNLLGGKGANLAEMTRMGFPVPQGFTVSTEACTRYYEDGRTIAPDIEERSTPPWPRPRRSPAKNSAMWRIRSWSLSAAARELLCLV